MLTKEQVALVQNAIDTTTIHGNTIFGCARDIWVVQAIKNHLKKRHALENLDFLNAINHVLKDEPSNQLSGLVNLYRDKIENNTVNLSDEIKKKLSPFLNEDDQNFIRPDELTDDNKIKLTTHLQQAVKEIFNLIRTNITEQEITTQSNLLKENKQNWLSVFQKLDELADPKDPRNKEDTIKYAREFSEALKKIYPSYNSEQLKDLISSEANEVSMLTYAHFQKLTAVMDTFELHDKPSEPSVAESRQQGQRSVGTIKLIPVSGEFVKHEEIGHSLAVVKRGMESLLNEKEERELEHGIATAKKYMGIYPYSRVEQHSTEFGLPTLNEYTDKITDMKQRERECLQRKNAVNTYSKWKSSIGIIIPPSLSKFNEDYAAYAKSLVEAQNPGASLFSKALSGENSIKAACEWLTIIRLMKTIEVLDEWLLSQSKQRSQPDLLGSKILNVKGDETYKNMLGLKESLIEEYADKIQNFYSSQIDQFMMAYRREPEVSAPQAKGSVVSPLSIFHASAYASSKNERLDRSNSRRTTLNSDATSSDSEGEGHWWEADAPRHQKPTTNPNSSSTSSGSDQEDNWWEVDTPRHQRKT